MIFYETVYNLFTNYQVQNHIQAISKSKLTDQAPSLSQIKLAYLEINSYSFHNSIIMLSIQKCQKYRSVTVSPQFRFTHQSNPSNPQYCKKQNKLSPMLISKSKHFYHQSELSSVKFRYLHKFDWQKLEKKFEIIQKLQQNKRNSVQPFLSSINFCNRQRKNSIDLKFELSLPDQLNIRNHSIASNSSKSQLLALRKDASMKQKLKYRLNEHKKFINEFGVNEKQNQRLYKVKRMRDTLNKKSIKRVINFHKPEIFLQ